MKQEDIDKINIMNIQRAKREYEGFLEKFKKNRCYLCGERLIFFDKKNLCLHWLLFPRGLKKKYFKNFFNKFDLFQINSYLMWISYQENNFTNINNLSLERDKNKIWETTIKYKNLKWSISCANTDFTGHEDSQINFPHYHFLMEVDGKPFISFNDYHIKLTKDDIIRIKAHNKPLGNFIHFWYIPGMEEMFSLGPEQLLKGMKTAKDESKAPFHLMGMFEMDGGISGEEIHKAMMKHKETGDTLIKCLSEIPDIKMQTIIEPGEGVPDLDRKLSRGKKKYKAKYKKKDGIVFI